MAISLVLTVLNEGESLRLLLDSLVAQTRPPDEFVVADGGSRDGTLSRIEPYRARINQVISERDRGIYDALNKGIALSQGEIVGFLHSDDRFASPQAVEHLVEALSAHQADGVYSDLEYIRSERSAETVLRHWRSCDFHPELLNRGWMPPHPTLYLKRSVYERVGLFDFRYSIAADYDFILRTFKEKDLRFAYLPEVTVQMRVGGASNGSLSRILKKSSEDYSILSRHGFNPIASLLLKNFSKIPQFFARTPK